MITTGAQRCTAGWNNSDAILLTADHATKSDASTEMVKGWSMLDMAERTNEERSTEAIVIKTLPPLQGKRLTEDLGKVQMLDASQEKQNEEPGSPSLLQIFSQQEVMPLNNAQDSILVEITFRRSDMTTKTTQQPLLMNDITDNSQQPVMTEENSSPQQMPTEIQDHGRELTEVLRLFKETTTKPISACVLPTPTHKIGTAEIAKSKIIQHNIEGKRESPRLKDKSKNGKSIIKKAQEMVARKCGIIQEEDSMDDMTLQQYINMYKQPLNETSRQAILKLTEVTSASTNKAKKKSKEKKKSTKDMEKSEKGEMGKIKKKKDKKGKSKMEADVAVN